MKISAKQEEAPTTHFVYLQIPLRHHSARLVSHNELVFPLWSDVDSYLERDQGIRSINGGPFTTLIIQIDAGTPVPPFVVSVSLPREDYVL